MTTQTLASAVPARDALPLQLRGLFVATFCGYLVFAVYAAAVRHGLFADGAAVVLNVITEQGLVHLQLSRSSAHLLHQLPTVVALKAGVTNLDALVFVYGLTLHLLPLLATVACLAVLPEDKKAFFVFPFLHFVLGTLGSALAPLAEAPVASALFWLLLCWTLFGRVSSWPQRLGLALLSCLALLLHEVYCFLGVALACAALYRASRESLVGRRALFAGLAAWFAVVVAVQLYCVLHPEQPANRQGFLASLLGLLWLGSGTAVNAPVALGLAGLAAVVARWVGLRFGRVRAAGPATLAMTLSFALLAAVAVALPLVSDRFVLPQSQFAARNHSAFVSLLLAGLAALTLRDRRPESLWPKLMPTASIGLVAIGSLGWLLVAAAYWARYVDDTKAVLASRTGLVSWQEARALVPEADRRIFDRYSWGWTPPTMSILLAPAGRVASMIDNRPGVPWAPFDPADVDSLPKSPLFSTDDYVAALRSRTGSGSKP